MRPSWAGLWSLIMFAVGLFLAAVSGMVQDEIRTRLGRVPYALIRLAVSRLPRDIRAELGDEWRSELAAILKAAEDVPVTGLVSAAWFAVGLLVRGTAISREFTGTARQSRYLRLLQVLSSHLRDCRSFTARLTGRNIPRQVTVGGASGGSMTIPLPLKIGLITACAMAAVANPLCA
jgi:hypothetical protein